MRQEYEFNAAEDQFIQENRPRLTWNAIGTHLGIPEAVARRRFNKLFRGNHADKDKSSPAGFEERQMKGDTQVITKVSNTVRTPEALIELLKIDTSVWIVVEATCRKWDQGAKTRSKQVSKDDWQRSLTVVELWYVHVRLKRKTSLQLANEELRQQILIDLAKYKPRHPTIHYKLAKQKERYLLDISIFDHHFGKLAWALETGENYDIEIATDLFLTAGRDLVRRAITICPNIDLITFAIGNDLNHTDNTSNTTTNGTPQDTPCRWHKAFRASYNAIIKLFDEWVKIAPIEGIVIAGNHDRSRAFYVGDVLQAHYRTSKNISIVNNMSPRCYKKYGNTLIGWTHGNEEKHVDLPLLMARETSSDWAAAKYFEWKVGHIHKSKETQFTAGDTYNGVKITTVPSLCATDAWHHLKGYVKGEKSAQATLYGHETGMNVVIHHFADQNKYK